MAHLTCTSFSLANHLNTAKELGPRELELAAAARDSEILPDSECDGSGSLLASLSKARTCTSFRRVAKKEDHLRAGADLSTEQL